MVDVNIQLACIIGGGSQVDSPVVVVNGKLTIQQFQEQGGNSLGSFGCGFLITKFKGIITNFKQFVNPSLYIFHTRIFLLPGGKLRGNPGPFSFGRKHSRRPDLYNWQSGSGFGRGVWEYGHES